VLVFSTYLGGSAHEGVQEIAVDAQGFVYVAGDTQSADFPTRDAAQPAFGGGLYDMFVVKLLPGGAGFVYATYLGGAGDDFGWGVAADCAGNAYVGGDSNSIDFPTLNPLQPALAGVYDAVIAKLDPTGGLLYATYLGGADDEGRANVAADCGGSIYVAGQTLSTDFPTAQPLQPTRGGGYDGFVAKLSPDGSALVYSTYLGGAANDALLAHVVDGAGRSYVAGVTSSRNFPTANPVQPTLRGFEDVFVSALSADGSALVYSTYLGGGSDDAAWGLTVDAAGNTYVVGRTESFDYPTVAPVQPAFGGGFQDAFVTKLGPGGSPIVYSTYLGGNDIDWLMDVAARPDGQAFVAGFSQSADFPTVNSMQDFSGFEDAVAARIAADGSELIYSSYFGGVGAEAWAIALDPVGTVYVAGIVDGDLPLRKPLQAEQAGARDGFIARINDAVFCLGREANLIGTPGDDVLFGTLGPDVVAALAGNDTVFGIAGNDLVCGGPGNDRLLGGDGADALVGEEGADLLVGGGGFDWCFGGPGTDGQSACESSAGIP
jgi:Ca2+-binding RTX toxin-like protein